MASFNPSTLSIPFDGLSALLPSPLLSAALVWGGGGGGGGGYILEKDLPE